MLEAKTAAQTLCEPVQAKCISTLYKSHLLQEFAGKVPQTSWSTLIKHRPLSYCKNPLVWTHCLGKRWWNPASNQPTRVQQSLPTWVILFSPPVIVDTEPDDSLPAVAGGILRDHLRSPVVFRWWTLGVSLSENSWVRWISIRSAACVLMCFAFKKYEYLTNQRKDLANNNKRTLEFERQEAF